MIWGMLIDQIRQVHIEFLDHFGIHPRLFLQDLELNTAGFPYPDANEDYGDWDPQPIPEKIAEAIELHPVERVLIEGPLLPIQEVNITSEHLSRIGDSLIQLEQEWLRLTRLSSEETLRFFETQIRTRIQQLQRRTSPAGLKSL